MKRARKAIPPPVRVPRVIPKTMPQVSGEIIIPARSAGMMISPFTCDWDGF
jgi:hypothetical protein